MNMCEIIFSDRRTSFFQNWAYQRGTKLNNSKSENPEREVGPIKLHHININAPYLYYQFDRVCRDVLWMVMKKHIIGELVNVGGL